MQIDVGGLWALRHLTAAVLLAFAAAGCADDDATAGTSGSAGEPTGAGESGGAGGESGVSGDGGTGEDGPDPTLFSGIVAGGGGGHVAGATVFLDLNGDWSIDPGEPSALTDADGRFSWPAVGDASRAPVVALVPDTATTTDTGARVHSAYVLAAPAGANTFVSPLSSLVAGLLQRYPGFTLEEAETAIRSKLGVSASGSLFEDLASDAASTSATAADSQKLQRVSRVLELGFGMDTAQAVSETDPANVFAMVMHNAEQQLPSVVLGVGGGPLADDALLAIAAFMKHVDAASLEERLDRSRRASKADFFDTFAGEGVFIPFPGPDGAVAGYARLGATSADGEAYSIPQSDFAYDIETSSYLPEPPLVEVGYALTPAGWVPRTAGDTPVFSSEADGAASLVGTWMRSAQRVTSNVIDVSGRSILSYAKGIDLVDRAARFPSGAVGYRLTTNSSSDEYATEEDDDRNPELATVTDLAGVETTYGDGGLFLRTASALSIRLSSDGRSRFTSGRDDMSLPLSGTWQRKLVEGVEVIEVGIPVSYKSEFDLLDATTDLFIAIVDGHARLGIVTRAGISETQDYYVFNRVGFDAVLAAAVENSDAVATFGQVAADGYIEGASVFLDLNDNGLLDDGEPRTDSDADGNYLLSWSARDFARHSIVAAVPATAFTRLPDQTGRFGVTQAFSLRAPPGQTLVTPYTTLAWHLLAKDPAYEYADAEAELAAILGTTGSLGDYLNAADSVQQKVRLVAGLLVEKLKEARGRVLAGASGVGAVVMNPDSAAVYQAMISASFDALPATVAEVEAMLALPSAPDYATTGARLDTFTDRAAWADTFGEALLVALFSALEEAINAVVRAIVAEVIDEIVDATVGEIPYVGWLLSPSVACAIKKKYELPC